MGTWSEKVRRLLATQGKSASKVARIAGWPVSTFVNSLNEGTMPAADRGVALAKALGVSAEWLFDDSFPVSDDPPVFGLLRGSELLGQLLGPALGQHPTAPGQTELVAHLSAKGGTQPQPQSRKRRAKQHR